MTQFKGFIKCLVVKGKLQQILDNYYDLSWIFNVFLLLKEIFTVISSVLLFSWLTNCNIQMTPL